MKKEWIEWILSWCDSTTEKDLPRILLVGDSITHGYQTLVRGLLKGVCYVDYLSVSYAIDTKMYNDLVKNFAKDSEYALIHFNHGLHGIHMTQRTYKSRMKKLLGELSKKSKIVLAKTTYVYESGNKKPHKAWMKRVKERNNVIDEFSLELQFPIDDLYAVSVGIPKEFREEDGTHYKADGYKILAEAVAESVKKSL